MMHGTALNIAAAMAAQGYGSAPADGSTDFRVYVFAAYGTVLLLLFLFTAWSVGQVAAARRKVEQLERRLDIARPDCLPGSDKGPTSHHER